MTQHLEVLVVEQVCDVGAATGIEVVDTEYVVAVVQQTFTKVRAEKAGTARHQDPLYTVIVPHFFS